MQQSLILLSVLASAVSTVFAAPTLDTSVNVELRDYDLLITTTFKTVNKRKSKRPYASTGPYNAVSVYVGDDADPDLRCQMLDKDNVPIVGNRGGARDVTFSDDGEGEWKFDNRTFVNQIICDPEFVSGGFDTMVTLNNPDTGTTSQTLFQNLVRRSVLPPSASSGPFKTVEIDVGPNSDPSLRCKISDKKGEAIVALRGGRRETTFNDAGKGPWTFERPQAQVDRIICDPGFVASPQQFA